MIEAKSEKRRIPSWAWLIIAVVLMLTGNIIAILISIFILIWRMHTDFKILLQKAREGRKKAIPVQRTLAEIDAMDGFEFEKCMKQIYESLGYSVNHTSLSGDQGADLILTSKEGVRTAVQLKRYSGKVSNKAVQEVVAAKAFHKCTKGMVVTNSCFTASAKQLARANDVNLVDRIELTKLLKESFSAMKGKQESEFPNSQNSSYKDSSGMECTMLSSNSINLYSETNKDATEKTKLATKNFTKTQMNIIIGVLVMSIALICIVGAAVTHSSTNAGTSKTVTLTESQDPTVAKVYTDGIQEPHLSKVIGNDYCECFCISTDKHGVYTAPSGSTYIIATIQIKNNGYSQISTSFNSWKLIADNVAYTPDSSTRVHHFGVPTEVGHGEQATITVTYLVQGNPQTAQLQYIE